MGKATNGLDRVSAAEAAACAERGSADSAANDVWPARRGRWSRAAAFLCVTLSALLLLSAASFILTPKNNQAAFGMLHQEAYGILGEPDRSIDALFIGDSETPSSISPLQMFSERGFTSYVCATNGQSLPYSLVLLEHSLRDQRPKVVALEANSIYARFSISDCVIRQLQNVFPAFEYHDRWKTISVEDLSTAPKATWVDPLKGFYANDATVAANADSHMEPSDESEGLPALNGAYLAAFASKCREVGARPVIIATPSTVCWSSARHNGMAQVAKALDIDFVDLNTGDFRVDVDWRTETRDAGDHLNYRGAIKVSRKVGEILSEVYQLPDHRGDGAFSAWSESLESYWQSVPGGKERYLQSVRYL